MRKGQLADIATHAPEVNQAFSEISQNLSDVGVELNAPTSYPYTPPETTIEVKPTPKPRTRKAAAKAPAASVTVKKTPAPKTAAEPKAAEARKPAAKTTAKTAPTKPRARKATVS